MMCEMPSMVAHSLISAQYLNQRGDASVMAWFVEA